MEIAFAARRAQEPRLKLVGQGPEVIGVQQAVENEKSVVLQRVEIAGERIVASR
jgi:hypothetical protein